MPTLNKHQTHPRQQHNTPTWRSPAAQAGVVAARAGPSRGNRCDLALAAAHPAAPLPVSWGGGGCATCLDRRTWMNIATYRMQWVDWRTFLNTHPTIKEPNRGCRFQSRMVSHCFCPSFCHKRITVSCCAGEKRCWLRKNKYR